MNPSLGQFCLGREGSFSDLVIVVINIELLLKQTMFSNFSQPFVQDPNLFQSSLQTPLFNYGLQIPQNNVFTLQNLNLAGFPQNIQPMQQLTQSYSQNPFVPTTLNNQQNAVAMVNNSSCCNLCNSEGHDFQNFQSRLSAPFCTKYGKYGDLFAICPTNTARSALTQVKSTSRIETLDFANGVKNAVTKKKTVSILRDTFKNRETPTVTDKAPRLTYIFFIKAITYRFVKENKYYFLPWQINAWSF